LALKLQSRLQGHEDEPMRKHHLRHSYLPIAALVFALPITASADRFDHSVPMQQQKSGNYYVHGVLSDGVETDFLVDTGSGYVSLSKNTFSRLERQNGTEYLRDILGAMANGKVVKVPVYRVATLTLGACVLADVEVAVFPGSARDILGLSALRRIEPFAMQLDPPVLMVSDCTVGAALAHVAAASLP
jgi:clan AA aspartic protease (TIGR02281 family)